MNVNKKWKKTFFILKKYYEKHKQILWAVCSAAPKLFSNFFNFIYYNMITFKNFYDEIDEERRKNWMHLNDRFKKVDWKKLKMSYYSEYVFMNAVRCKHLWFWKNDFFCYKNKRYIEIKSIFLRSEASTTPKKIYVEDYKITQNTDIVLFIYDVNFKIKTVLYANTKKFNLVETMELFGKKFVNRIIEPNNCEDVTNYFQKSI